MKLTANFYQNSVRRCIFLLTLFILTIDDPVVYGQQPFSEKGGDIISSKPPPGDTIAINLLIKRALLLRETATDSAIMLFSESLSQSRKLRYRIGMARSLQGLGRSYSNKNELDKALLASQQALMFCENNLSGKSMAASIRIMLSQIYYYQGKLDSCAFYRYEALNDVTSNPGMNPSTQIQVYGNMLHFWLNIHEDIRYDHYVSEIMQYMNALENTALASRDTTSLLNIYFYKGGYYNNIRENDSARYYFERNIAMGRIRNVAPSIIAGALLNISNTYMEDEMPSRALSYINEAINTIPVSGRERTSQFIIAEVFKGKAYLQLKDYARAISFTESALQRATQLNILRHTEDAHETLAEAYTATGNYKLAAEHQKLYSDTRDSMMKSEKLEIVYNVEMKYRIADKNKELAQKELALARNESRLRMKNTWIIAISGGLLALLMVSFLVIRNIRQKAQIGSLQAMISGEENERSRIARDLHDGMGGTLGTIRTRLSAIFRKHKTTDVDEDFMELMKMLEEAASELRKTAHNLMPEILLQEGLAKAVEIFCSRIHKANVLEINTEIWGSIRRLPKDVELTSYRIIQELINNIMKHANATVVMVQIIFHETQLCITVEDNGIGMPLENTGKKGMGLQTIRQRVQSLSGQIDIVSKPEEGTSVYIEINIIAQKGSVFS